MVGKRFFYNDGFFYMVDELEDSCSLEIRPVKDGPADSFAELNLRQFGSEETTSIYLTKEVARNIITYLTEVLEEK